MDYGRWIKEAFYTLAHNMYLWVLTLPWLGLLWLDNVLSGGIFIGWAFTLRRITAGPELNRLLAPANTPGEVLRVIPRLFYYLLGGRTYALVGVLVIGFVLWLLRIFLTGAVIHQAASRPDSPSPRLEESLHEGIRSAPCVFLVQVFMVIVGILIALPFFLLYILLFARILHGAGSETLGTYLVGMFMGTFCLLLPFSLLLYFFLSLYKNLVYQACVQGKHGFGTALVVAWRVLRQRFGPVIVLGLIAVVVNFVLGLVQSGFSQVIKILFQAEGAGVIFGYFIWIGIALLLAFIILVQEIFVLILYTRAWPDLTIEEGSSG